MHIVNKCSAEIKSDGIYKRESLTTQNNHLPVGISCFSFLVALEHVSGGHFTDISQGLPFAVNFLLP